MTDGEPTPEKIAPDTAMDLAEQYGIRVYTIGIGNEQGAYLAQPFYGVQRVQVKLDPKLLQKIAVENL